MLLVYLGCGVPYLFDDAVYLLNELCEDIRPDLSVL